MDNGFKVALAFSGLGLLFMFISLFVLGIVEWLRKLVG
jgi:hypothetical protein